MKTLVSLLLDETGSMESIKDDTIGGFNDYVKSLQALPEAKDIYLTFTTFDSNHYTPRFVAKPIADVPLLTKDTYRPGAATPLYDAVGKTATATSQWVDKERASKEEVRVLFVIQTDGQENASNEFTLQKVKDLISAKSADGWSFIYLGAGADSWSGAGAMGISKGNTLNYAHTGAATRATSATLSAATATFSASSLGATTDFFKDNHVPVQPTAGSSTQPMKKGSWSNTDPFQTTSGSST